MGGGGELQRGGHKQGGRVQRGGQEIEMVPRYRPIALALQGERERGSGNSGSTSSVTSYSLPLSIPYSLFLSTSLLT
jgi:hypothetical protein